MYQSKAQQSIDIVLKQFSRGINSLINQGNTLLWSNSLISQGNTL